MGTAVGPILRRFRTVQASCLLNPGASTDETSRVIADFLGVTTATLRVHLGLGWRQIDLDEARPADGTGCDVSARAPVRVSVPAPQGECWFVREGGTSVYLRLRQLTALVADRSGALPLTSGVQSWSSIGSCYAVELWTDVTMTELGVAAHLIESRRVLFPDSYAAASHQDPELGDPWTGYRPHLFELLGYGGAAITLRGHVISATAAERAAPTLVFDVRSHSPHSSSAYLSRPASPALTTGLAEFFGRAASDLHPELTLPTYSDPVLGLTVSVTASTADQVTLDVVLVKDPHAAVIEHDGLNFETSRAAMATASHTISGLASPSD